MTVNNSNINKHLSSLNNLKTILIYCYEKNKDIKTTRAQTLSSIAEIEFKISKINLEIEVMEDPTNRPLETGEEAPALEKLIRSMEADVKYLEGDLLLLKGDLATYEADIKLYEDQISNKLYDLKELKDDLEKKLNPNEDFERTFGDFFKKAWSIEAEYKKNNEF